MSPEGPQASNASCCCNFVVRLWSSCVGSAKHHDVGFASRVQKRPINASRDGMDLYEACENGNEERVVELLVFGEDWLGVRLGRRSSVPSSAQRLESVRSDGDGNSSSKANALVAAAATAIGLVLSPQEMLQARGTAGRTPLHAACMGGQAGVVRLLLGEPCRVYFTSRTRQETEDLLAPLREEHEAAKPPGSAPTALFDVTMAAKDGDADPVPVATVQFAPERCIASQDLIESRKHVDDFGNTALQCVSCFGCGSSERHIADGLEITKHLLLHGDQPNVPKLSDKWTPLHWSAYNGNHEQVALLLNPAAFLDDHQQRIGKMQASIPLFVNSDNLFPVDIAGRRGFALLSERAELTHRRLRSRSDEYARWRLRLDHVDVLRNFTREFLENASQLTRYVNEMNTRLPLLALRDKHAKKKRFTHADAIRYGQHLLYWAGCFGLVDIVRALLELKMEVATSSSATLAANAVATGENAPIRTCLQPLYVCSCEENKRQSVLHAVASHGQHEIVTLLLSKMLFDQQRPPPSLRPAPTTAKSKHGRTWKSAIAPVNTRFDERVAAEDANECSATPQGSDERPNDGSGSAQDKLDVLRLVNTGWRNYRSETPLFLAVLYLQHSVVVAFANFLTRQSLEWELANCNVEGSYIHHVVHDHSRQVLGIQSHHKMVCAEYVLLFDGVKKKQFKETVVETLREESPVAPALVVTRAGKRVEPACWYSMRWRPTQTDFIVVGATDAVLVRHAEALQLKIRHRGSTVRSKYNASTPQVFEPFRSLQRQQVVMDIIQKNMNLKKHLRKRNLLAIFPLHDASGCKNIMRAWVYTDDHRRVFQPFTGNSVQQFLFEERTHQYEMLWPLLTYFGEKHAFYYAFGAYYSVWLLLIAVPGAICQVLATVAGVYFPSPLFAVIVSIWATLVVERWKRKKSEVQRSFGAFKRNRNEAAPDFYGDFQVETIEKSVVDVKFPKSLQLLRIYAGLPVLLTMASLVVVIFIGVKVTTVSSDIARDAPSWLPKALLPYVIPFLNAVTMLILDTMYTEVALALTLWENHRTVWQYESMLAAKLWSFKFLNAFIALAWVAFVDQDAAALRNQLITVMGVRQLWYMFVRSIWPLLLVQMRWRQRGFHLKSRSANKKPTRFTITREWYNAELPGDASVAPPNTAVQQSVPSLVLVQEMMLPPDFLMGKQMEVVLQFGYITMFVSVLPIGPLLALLVNVVNMRLDVICCTQAKRRPPFESETEVSTFMSILEFMSFAAVTVNCAVLFFTTRSDLESVLQLASSHWTDDPAYYFMKLWIVLVIEHLVLGAKALLSLVIDDSPTWVQNDEDRNDDEEKQKHQRDTDVTPGEGDQLVARVPTSEREVAQTSDEAQRVVGAEYEHLVDELLAEAVDWKKNAQRLSERSCSALNGVLVEKYSAAVKERDQALQREKLAQERLAECLKQVEQLKQQRQQQQNPLQTSVRTNAAATESIGDESLPPGISVAPSTIAGGDVPSSDALEAASRHRKCLVCFLVRGASVGAAKRCLSCRAFTCLECDERLHLDDLGVKESVHCRVNVPNTKYLEALGSAVAGSRDLQRLSDLQLLDTRITTATSSNCDADTLDELRALVEEYVSVFNEEEKHGDGGSDADARLTDSALLLSSSTWTAPIPLDASRVYQTCMARPQLVLRYLRNERRRRQQRRHAK